MKIFMLLAVACVAGCSGNNQTTRKTEPAKKTEAATIQFTNEMKAMIEDLRKMYADYKPTELYTFNEWIKTLDIPGLDFEYQKRKTLLTKEEQERPDSPFTKITRAELALLTEIVKLYKPWLLKG